VLTGSARLSQEEHEKAAGTSRRQELEGRRRELERERRTFEARMATLRTEHEAKEERIQRTISESESLGKEASKARGQMVQSRKADSSPYNTEGGAKAAKKH
jgi:chromosome segregation ATPase